MIVDGASLVARAWYACKEVASETESLAASLLASTVRTTGVPERLLFCWDGRHKPKKPHRVPKPEAFYQVIETFKQSTTACLNAAHSHIDTEDGDNQVATAVEQTSGRLIVVSGDKDLQQLQCDERVRYFDLVKKCVLNAAWITHQWGIKHPNQLAIALAIIGDSVDGIKGVRGWGPAKAKKLFEAVTPKMTFQEAFACVDSQVPEAKKAEFYEALELTLLNREVPGVTPPNTVDLRFDETLGMLSGLAQAFGGLPEYR